VDTSDTTRPIHTIRESPGSFDVLVHSANSTLERARVYSIGLLSGESDIDAASAMVPCCLYQAGIVFAFLWNATKEKESLDALYGIKHTLKALHRRRRVSGKEAFLYLSSRLL
jgi:hypothetical protein